ncbi:2-succinyl-5-enolpyruvyl-6-hydroxy-3-cyclohexene-1-carboxylic-acid synthase [Ktedonobacter racemifer]|uniref:2-succinyl-5-enolpyruvyl-6-hydroxy-3-cyclohexene-1-carboxylate synthase n=1 Tax=Ktedonobacter racemifer DSM 44963 TaxID=485913 RepID=D6TLZ8_KTERA|nr:2-succinyl-5-enolpyruvyl-6-hydroxy-3-cyclohexene-1-carboxylic-acid synthase [Ktedonobacter racemifer]EFH86798.1 2-succinyl-6-hydroxy-2,4-cyclohexadiene-1- carboxylic acid synthase/2-oxoglutarate decarboxylase [Ktedonobacter racemifer DSM 44963]
MQSQEHLRPQNATYAYVGAFVEELARAGVHHVVYCPGSRSTPLAYIFAQSPHIRAWLHVDERSAAFFALGLAKALGETVALFCTSGTAAANFFPAVVEAHLTHVPLLVLTADRPHELRESGAPQAIDQNRLFGTHTKWFMDVALPEASQPALRYIRALAHRASALTHAMPAGPVHLNMPFREPLTQGPQPGAPLPPPEERLTTAWQGRDNDLPYTAVHEAPLGRLPEATLSMLAARLQQQPRGLIVVGPGTDPTLASALIPLAQKLGYPILADPLSQLRCAPIDQQLVISSYDAFLRLNTFAERYEPEVVLRFGPMPVAKPFLLYLQRYPGCQQIVIDGQGDWQDPTHLSSMMLHTEPAAFCRDLLATLIDTEAPESSSWLAAWQQADQLTRQALYTAIQDFTEPFEGRVFTELAELLPTEATLFVGNSMPVRDLDTFFWCQSRSIRVLANRGANGIDGVISSALGTSAANAVQEQPAPTVLVIGDLSFFHDLNGLLAARLHKLNLTIVLVNNDGGGIFSFLPQAAQPAHFEELFGTPTGLDFAPVVGMYGGHYSLAEDWNAFRQAITTGIDQGGLNVVEVRTERASNVAMHRQLWQVVDKALKDLA